MHISADVQRITLNASCMTTSGGRTEQLDIIAGFLPCHWLYEWFSQFHSCGTYSVLSRSPSVVKEMLYWLQIYEHVNVHQLSELPVHLYFLIWLLATTLLQSWQMATVNRNCSRLSAMITVTELLTVTINSSNVTTSRNARGTCHLLSAIKLQFQELCRKCHWLLILKMLT